MTGDLPRLNATVAEDMHTRAEQLMRAQGDCNDADLERLGFTQRQISEHGPAALRAARAEVYGTDG